MTLPMPTLTANVRSVSEQISELGESCTHSVALSHGDRQLTYYELNRRADRFGGHLAQLGVVVGCTVAICMERSFDWIVAALGTMRAGAAYVPLDSAWPDSRLRFAVRDSGATAVVARAALLDRLQVTARGVDPCRDAAAIAAAPGAAQQRIQRDGLAYVIYTSGSTGVPKGVEITHANLAHLIRWHREAFGVTQRDRASHLAGLGFDAAVWEIWPHLSAGATVCLPDDTVRSSPDLIQQWMIREHITIGFVPTVHAAPMMAMNWPAATSLRFLLTGGDTLHHAPSVRLPFEVVNNYGPTECTVVATSSVLEPRSQGAPPIGRPITGTSVYLLDEEGKPVPDGTAGEIYIGGSGVGRGYRNLPDSTERSFLPDPFAGAPSARMYRTGDRGVRRPDGEIEFRGRLDRQTKIRGQRVELDEISSVLSRHPSVDFAAAISSISPTGENQLVAYVLPKENANVLTAQELQSHLLRTLPDYMVPATFVRLEALPVSPNGKLDLTMLPAPADAHLMNGRAGKGLASRTEEKLLTIVRKLLCNDAVAAEDSFFLAGGHSLLGMQLVMRLRESFGVDLTLRQLFEAPTVERLALLVDSILDEERVAGIWAAVLGRELVGLDDNFFDLGGEPALLAAVQQRIAAEFGQTIPISELSEAPTVRQQANLAQRRVMDKPDLPSGVLALQPNGTRNGIFWVHYLSVNLAKVIGDDQPLLYVALTSEDFPALGQKPTLQRIAACLLQRIFATQPNGPYAIGGYCLGGILGYEIASQLRAAGHEVSLLVLVDPPNPSYIESLDSPRRVASYLRYVAQRARRLGLRTSLTYVGEHIAKRFKRAVTPRSLKTETAIAQELIEAAAFAYEPQKYDGKVLLMLASERPPHVDILPGWQAVVPQLHTEILTAHHRDLLKVQNARRVADAIVSHLLPSAR
jgi:amino acid adenylation domain-containing protein